MENSKNDILEAQYKEMAEIIEVEGLGYALVGGGYLKPEHTDDLELKEAIQTAIESCNKIMNILSPYLP